jgi:hypothetical protein
MPHPREFHPIRRPMRRVPRLLPSLLFAPLALSSAAELPSRAQPVDPLAGSWTLDANASDDIGEAIEKTVAPLNFVVRPIARRRLAAVNAPFASVRLERAGSDVTITWMGGRPARATVNGPAVPYRDARGEAMTFRVRESPAGALSEQYDTEDGVRTNTWTLDDTSTLSVRIEVRGARLKRPLTYRLVYVRPAGA